MSGPSVSDQGSQNDPRQKKPFDMIKILVSFIRSVRLWLGLATLVFVGWAWRDSNLQLSHAGYEPSWELSADSGHGHLLLTHLSREATSRYRIDYWLGTIFPVVALLPSNGAISCSFGVPARSTNFSFYQLPVPPQRRTWFPPFQYQSSTDPLAPFWLVALPYWQILIALMVAWAAVEGWWLRRKRSGITPKRAPASY